MVRFIYTLFCCIVLALCADAQIPLNDQEYADSLQEILKGHHLDSISARAAFQLTEYYAYRDTTRSAYFLTESKKLLGGSPLLQALYPFYNGILVAKTQGK